MFCYQDRTFCIAKCAAVDCRRKATDKVFEAADKEGVGVSVTDFSKTCSDYVEVKE